MIYLTRGYDFSASHRLYNPQWSDEENWRVFRECSYKNGHGHNYLLEVTVAGAPDSTTGMVVDLVALDTAVKAYLLDIVDHRHMNYDVTFLADVIPTAENMVVAFWQQLAPHIPAPAKLHRLRLHETRNNMAEYSGS